MSVLHMLPLLLISYVFESWSHVYILRLVEFNGGMMFLLEPLNLCTSMGSSWQFLDDALMSPIPRHSRNLLKLSPLTPLMLICKSNLLSFIMTSRLWKTMFLKGPKSKLAFIGWKLAIRILKSSFRILELVIPISGLKRSNREILFSLVSLTS